MEYFVQSYRCHKSSSSVTKELGILKKVTAFMAISIQNFFNCNFDRYAIKHRLTAIMFLAC